MDIEIIRGQLYLLNFHKSIVTHSSLLKDVTAGLLLILCGRFWESGEVPSDWKLANAIPIY